MKKEQKEKKYYSEYNLKYYSKYECIKVNNEVIYYPFFL